MNSTYPINFYLLQDFHVLKMASVELSPATQYNSTDLALSLSADCGALDSQHSGRLTFLAQSVLLSLTLSLSLY